MLQFAYAETERPIGGRPRNQACINRILIVFGMELSGFMIFPHSLLKLSFHLEFTQMKIQVQLWL